MNWQSNTNHNDVEDNFEDVEDNFKLFFVKLLLFS